MSTECSICFGSFAESPGAPIYKCSQKGRSAEGRNKPHPLFHRQCIQSWAVAKFDLDNPILHPVTCWFPGCKTSISDLVPLGKRTVRFIKKSPATVIVAAGLAITGLGFSVSPLNFLPLPAILIEGAKAVTAASAGALAATAARSELGIVSTTAAGFAGIYSATSAGTGALIAVVPAMTSAGFANTFAELGMNIGVVFPRRPKIMDFVQTGAATAGIAALATLASGDGMAMASALAIASALSTGMFAAKIFRRIRD